MAVPKARDLAAKFNAAREKLRMKSLPNIQEDNRIAAEKAQAKEKSRQAFANLDYLDHFLRLYDLQQDMALSTSDGAVMYIIDHDPELKNEILKALRLKRVRLIHEANGAR